MLRLTRNLRAYFAEEVIERQPPALRQILTEVSILPVVGREIAQAVTGRSDVGKLLEEAVDRGLFICRAENERTGYHLHPLFRETLRDLLHEEDARHAAELHRRGRRTLGGAGRVGACPVACRSEWRHRVPCRRAGTPGRANDLSR